jgi:hypothetical protein
VKQFSQLIRLERREQFWRAPLDQVLFIPGPSDRGRGDVDETSAFKVECTPLPHQDDCS